MTRPSLASLILITSAAVLLYLASRHPWETALVWIVCALVLAAIEGGERRHPEHIHQALGRREWADDAQIIRGATSAPSPGHQAETHDEGDSHDHAV